MEDFIVDNIFKIIIGIFVVLIGVVISLTWYEQTHCLSHHIGEKYYHAPMYIKSGNVMIPVSGGYYGDDICDKWK